MPDRPERTPPAGPPPTVLRSMLFAPGNHPRRVEKSFTLGADAVILDLEDAVEVAEKPAARARVVEALSRPRTCRGYVRINAATSEWGYADLVAVVRPGVDGIVLPKVESAETLKAVEWVVGALERERGLPARGIDILPLVETGLGLARLHEIAGSGTRARRIAFGAGDFTLDLGLAWSGDEAELLPYRAQVVAASRAAGLEPPIDTVWIDLQNRDGFLHSIDRARRQGFQGKLCIHPDQVPPVNAAYTPSEADLARARRIVQAFTAAEAEGVASIRVDGRFVDYPIVAAARRLIARAEAIRSPEGAGHASSA